MEKNNFETWLDAYLHIRNIFCGRCEIDCNEKRKLACIEIFLYIIEHWEYENELAKKDN